jgi:hypothetical protein
MTVPFAANICPYFWRGIALRRDRSARSDNLTSAGPRSLDLMCPARPMFTNHGQPDEGLWLTTDQRSKAAKVTFPLCPQPDARVGVEAGAWAPSRAPPPAPSPSATVQGVGDRSIRRETRYARHAVFLSFASELRIAPRKSGPGNEHGRPGSPRMADVADRM